MAMPTHWRHRLPNIFLETFRRRAQLLPQPRRNLRAVETPIFNEDFARPRARHHHTRQVDSWNIALQRLRIELRRAVDSC